MSSSTLNSLRTLSNVLRKVSHDEYSAKITSNMADTMSGKKKLVKTRDDFFKYLNDNIVDIEIDAPKGSKKGFGGKKRVLPFHYGEVTGAINIADNMGWDVIFPPSQEDPSAIKKAVPIGIVEVNPDEATWMKNGNKMPPIGNDKIIVSKDGKISEEDKSIISNFFNGMWQFKEIVWL